MDYLCYSPPGSGNPAFRELLENHCHFPAGGSLRAALKTATAGPFMGAPLPRPNYEADLNCTLNFDGRVDFILRRW